MRSIAGAFRPRRARTACSKQGAAAPFPGRDGDRPGHDPLAHGQHGVLLCAARAGAGSFYGAFPRYRGPEIGAYFDHAHNDYTQFLVETGPLGALLIGTLPLLALINAVLALSRRRDPLARGFAFAVLMGVCSIAIHSTVDFNLQIPANAFAFVVLLAYAWIALFLDRRNSGSGS